MNPDRLPPQNIEAEQNVLGAILLDNEVLHEVVPILAVENFYRDTHQAIYRAIRDLYDLGKPVDGLILGDELSRRGQLEAIGGHDALLQLVAATPHAANAVYHARIVREKSIGRQIIEAATEMLGEVYSGDFTADELIEKAQKKAFALADQGDGDGLWTAADATRKALEVIEKRRHQGMAGLESPWGDLDRITDGFSNGSVTIVAARPSMGKTAFALQIAEHAAVEAGRTALFCSLEMALEEIGERMLYGRSGVPGKRLKQTRMLSAADECAIGRADTDWSNSQLHIYDVPSPSMTDVAAAARRVARGPGGLGLLVVDYIQLVEAENEKVNRQEQIAKISRRLKTLARELACPVIAMSQLNRESEKREDRRPRMSDLRESGAIEQDADMVILLHRPEYHDPDDQRGLAEAIVAKNRSGMTGTAKLGFSKKITRFVDWEGVDPDRNDEADARAV